MATQGPAQLPVGSLFREYKPLTVPAIQRPYSWTRDQVDDFCSDIERLAGRPQGSEHFFGTIIVVVEPRTGFTPSNHVLIDGQQRVSTLLLALAVLREGFQSLASKLSDSAEEAPLIAECKKSDSALHDVLHFQDRNVQTMIGTERVTLLVEGGSGRTFERLLENEKGTLESDPERKYDRAKSRIRDRLVAPLKIRQLRRKQSTLEEKKRAFGSLSRMQDALLTRAQVLLYQLEDRDKAYRLFSVLNDRGRPLSQGDLLRTKLLELCIASDEKGHFESTKGAWDELMKRQDDLESFIRHFFSSHQGRRWPAERLYIEFIEAWHLDEVGIAKSELSRRAAEVSEALRREFILWDSIRRGLAPQESSVGSWYANRIHRIVKILKVDQAVPTLLAAASKLPKSDLQYVVLRLDLFLFRYLLCKAHKSSLGDTLFAMAKAIRQSVELKRDQFDRIIRTALSAKASDREFSNAVREMSYDTHGAPMLWHFFSTLYQYESPSTAYGKPPKFKTHEVYHLESASLQVEHLYPQRPTKDNSDASLDEVLHSLGNLTILGPGENATLGNRPWSEKREILKHSSISANGTLAHELASLDRAAVDLRHGQLVVRAAEAWRAPGGNLEEEDHSGQFYLFVIESEVALEENFVVFQRTYKAAEQLAEGDNCIFVVNEPGTSMNLVVAGVAKIKSLSAIENEDRVVRADLDEVVYPGAPVVVSISEAGSKYNATRLVNRAKPAWATSFVSALTSADDGTEGSVDDPANRAEDA